MADSDNQQSTRRNKSVILNVVYSLLVFVALCCIGVAIFDPAAITRKGETSSAGLLVFGLSIVLTIVFSMWFAKRGSRKL